MLLLFFLSLSFELMNLSAATVVTVVANVAVAAAVVTATITNAAVRWKDEEEVTEVVLSRSCVSDYSLCR